MIRPILPQEKEIALLFEQEGIRLYAVGGMVRNALLSLPASPNHGQSYLPN